ncbi:hypothetical protein PSQ19_05975 [Devosia algicola]|uniref:Uncharacterized protein n=1 Tax=Devosia algicola TaxID=3026418 RepID=A0ABY7YRV2_9HYPH|nr:hypothetical protein [Devosia algicola]WDR03615.1 hypothetical protein PSQ19_05975 [Devosia algicola]
MAVYTGSWPFTLSVDANGVYSLTDEVAPSAPVTAPGVAFAGYTQSVPLSALIPADDTVPQSYEGTEILSVPFAASSETAAVLVDFSGSAFNDTGDGAIISTLFIDSETNARQTALANPPAAGYFVTASLKYQLVPGDTELHTYKIRVGGASGTIRFNGTGAGRLFGGSAAAILAVSESGEPP